MWYVLRKILVCLISLVHGNNAEPAIFVAAFNNEDPGVDQIAQRCAYHPYSCSANSKFSKHFLFFFFFPVFGLPPTFVAAALGGNVGIQQVAGLESKVSDNPSSDSGPHSPSYYPHTSLPKDASLTLISVPPQRFQATSHWEPKNV